MAEGEPPVTRLSVAPEPLLMVTLLPWPIEKLRQSITPRVEPGCVMTIPFVLPAIDPCPLTNWPPCGNGPPAKATGANMTDANGTANSTVSLARVWRGNCDVAIIRHTNGDSMLISVARMRVSRGAAH